MLIEFKVANFRSIREEQKFSLVANNADKSLSDCMINRPLPGLTGVKFLKGAAIYGPNASGKSNIYFALNFVQNLVAFSGTRLAPGAPTGTQPFKLDRDSASKPSIFEVTFEAAGVRYVFGVSVTSKRVIEEYLVAYPKGSPQRWYHRRYNETTGYYEWSKSSTGFKHDKSLQDKTRENSLFLSVGPQFNHPQLTVIYDWFRTNLNFIFLSHDAIFHPAFTARMVAQRSQHDRILNLLRSADIGVTDATAKELDINNLEIFLKHKAEGLDPVSLDFKNDESSGTRRFFALLGPWTHLLEHGYTVFIDEIETSLHPILVKELLKLVFCRKNNRKGAQVIFTTHNLTLLDSTLIRRDQIWFTEKTDSGATHLYPLTDYQPRKDEALGKGYLAGRYGAIPFLPDGLKLKAQ